LYFIISKFPHISVFFILSGKQSTHLLCRIGWELLLDLHLSEIGILATLFGTKKPKPPFFWDETPRLGAISEVLGRQSDLVSRVYMPLFSDISILECNTTLSSRNVGNQLTQ
jgi:hypothetical protein